MYLLPTSLYIIYHKSLLIYKKYVQSESNFISLRYPTSSYKKKYLKNKITGIIV